MATCLSVETVYILGFVHCVKMEGSWFRTDDANGMPTLVLDGQPHLDPKELFF